MPIIRGRVLDKEGAPVAQAAVYVVAAPQPQPDIAQLTGADGAFDVDAGSPGAYVIGARSDTAGGQSGACVYIVRGGQRIAVAIHAYGGATANSGTRISSEVFANLTAWKRS